MAVGVMYGDNADVNALLYQTPRQGTIDFIQQRMQHASQQVMGAGRQFFEQAKTVYERFAGEDALRRAKAAKRSAGSFWDEDEIRETSTVEALQGANNAMRRWVMANPTIRKLYAQQRVEGYDGLYTNPFPDDDPHDSYDYRRVMNGVVEEFVDEDGEDSWRVTSWCEDLLPDDRELDIVEQNDILNTWEAVEAILKRKKEDPTSRWGADLS